MSEIPSLHPKLKHWLFDGPLAAYVPAYLERLERGRYASSTSQQCLSAIAHLRLNPQLQAMSVLLPNRDCKPMTRNKVNQRLALAVQTATVAQPQLAKRCISPHIIRHTTAMHLLQSGVDISVIALWLGHESPTTTHQYVEADLKMKVQALGKLQEPDVVVRRYKAPDSLIEFLKTL